MTYESWGRFPKANHTAIWRASWRDDCLPPADTGPLLPFGNGRSYGDVCLNDGGVLLDCRDLDRFISFDPATGTLRCESGVLLSDILSVFVPRGWFVPVTPGTKFVTVGGAVANDVHGKNHHRAGSFGCHVDCLELLTSNGERVVCSPGQHRELFEATVGGLGLTGFITWVQLRLRQVPGPSIEHEIVRFFALSEFFEHTAQSDDAYEYTVAWVDCTAKGNALGRGLFMRGNHSTRKNGVSAAVRAPSLAIPFVPPVSLVQPALLRVFNSAYFHKHVRNRRRYIDHYDVFFYPLDSIANWNRLYGRNGFVQYQCVIPWRDAKVAMGEMLDRIARARTGSLLAVLKVFGNARSPGLLSFPRSGVTLALDFPMRGPGTNKLLDDLDVITTSAQGAVYPAKDARMSATTFRQSFPRWPEWARFIDPRFSSSFWRRVAA